MRVILELDTPTDGQTLAVDMDGDGRLTMADVVLVIHRLLGI
ncbi:MAG: dockerin type I domain-containing protein [Clostridiales Family XIII bacterium]|nr:dockerin type I domain-containing protein [Clostridiales Family XIII bacterium]